MSTSDFLIVGGGFSGLLLARHLKNLIPEKKISIIALESEIGGAAYRGASKSAVLNVPHWNMSAFPDDPNHFTKFVTEQRLELIDEAFAKRSDYLLYLDEIRQSLVRDGVRFVDARAISTKYDGKHWQVQHSKDTDSAPKLILALGNGLPAEILHSELNPSCLINNPWKPNVLGALSEKQTIILVGTGLTAMDIIWELALAGHQGKIIAISRRGLLPHSHDLSVKPITWDGPLSSLRSIVRHVRGNSKMYPWRAVIDGMRPVTQSIWQNMSIKEKKLFIRRLRPYWDVCRHRISPSIYQKCRTLIESAKLKVICGTVKKVLQTSEHELQVNIATASGHQMEPCFANVVINCTGPRQLIRGASSLVDSLLQADQASLDEFGLGLITDSEGRILNHSGTPSTCYALGSLRKATLWENTAVPELRKEAQKLAQTLIADCL